MERIIDVVKVLGKCGLNYRGHPAEAAYMLDNPSVNHGNFLELVLLVSRYDLCLQKHVKTCIEESQKHHESGSKGRGSLVTLMSNNIVSKVVNVVSQLIKRSIADEVKEAAMFSVQIGTTQDITSTDQCAIVLRYVTETVQERLIGVVNCKKSAGQYFLELLKKTLLNLDLDVSKCVGNSTDGAANMQGSYQGFSAFLSQQSPTQVHVWCYAHVLNLVLSDTTSSVIESATIFSLLSDVAVFLRESIKRMQMWEEVSNDERHQRLIPIGETRWWAKDQALSKAFGSFSSTDSALYVDLVLTLAKVLNDTTMKPTVRAKAQGFLDTLLKYEVILTAQTFLRVFQHTSPLSKYLQTQGMDILSAQRLVEGMQDSLKHCL